VFNHPINTQNTLKCFCNFTHNSESAYILIQMFGSKIKNDSFFYGTLGCLAFCLFYFQQFSIFFEEYEAYFTSMLAGKITPGISYNHLYYYGQIGISTIYSKLYSITNNIPWIPLFYEFFLIVAFYLFTKIFFNGLNTFKRFFISFFILLLINEHLFILNITRVSFVLIMLGSFILLQPNLTNKIKYFAQFIVLFGILTRSEPAFLTIFLVLFGDFLIYQNFTIKERFMRWLKLFWPHFVLLIVLFIYFQIDFKTSNQFYKQIEPDVEYQLMVRENFKTIPSNADSIYIMRYQAVKKGIWGDCETNNNFFLRSLIEKSGSNDDKIISSNYYTIKDLLAKNKPITGLLIVLFIISLSSTIGKSKKETLMVLANICALFFVILIVSIQVKMVDRGFVSLLTIGCFIYILHIKNRKVTIPKIGLIAVIFIFGYYQINAVSTKLTTLEKEVKHNKLCLKKVKSVVSKKEIIFLGQSSINVFFLSQTPFGASTDFRNVYVFNALAFTTIEPYRSYLKQKLHCNPNNYLSFFEVALKINCIFLLNKNESSFLANYLRIVHHKKITFIPKNNATFRDAFGTLFYAYKIVEY